MTSFETDIMRLSTLPTGTLRSERIENGIPRANLQYYDHKVLRSLQLQNDDVRMVKEQLAEARSLIAQLRPVMQALLVNSPAEHTNIVKLLREGRRQSLAKLIASQKNFDTYRFYTSHGDYVCSKSEAIISEFLFKIGVHYCYELPLKVRNGVILHLDFTLFLKRTCYLEHRGMDDAKYTTSTDWRRKRLDELGIHENELLLITHEDQIDLYKLEEAFWTWVRRNNLI